jgi:hypothetical protein
MLHLAADVIQRNQHYECYVGLWPTDDKSQEPIVYEHRSFPPSPYELVPLHVWIMEQVGRVCLEIAEDHDQQLF